MELLQKYAQKMGLKADNPLLLDKAEEIRRLWEAKGASAGGPNSSSLMVVYLDLSAQILGLHGEQRSAKRISVLAGFKNPAPYSALLNNIKSQLQLKSKDGDLTVEEVCVRLGVTTARIPSLKLLKSYVDFIGKKFPLSKMKISPAHTTASVAVVCKSSKIPYDKTRLFNLSEAPSRTVLNKLIFDMTLHLKESTSESSARRSDSKNAAAPLPLTSMDNKIERSRKKRDQPMDEEEDYQVWKARILRKANLVDPCK